MEKYKKSIGLLFFILFTACQPDTKNILYINSYHSGYGSSDDITNGIKATLSETDIDLKIIYMDTKRNADERYIKQITLLILDRIIQSSPDLIIVSDDNALQFIVNDNLKEVSIPIVFCGVNWSIDQYQLPRNHITGMLEVIPFEQGVNLIKKFKPEINKVLVLSENTASEEKNTKYIRQIAEKLHIDISYHLAQDFEEWKSGFKVGNTSSDLIYMPTNGAIKNWNDEEAIQFISENIRVPVITCDDFMMPFSTIGLTKVQSEQGIWAAETAIKIMNGQEPLSIPLVENVQTQIWYNPFLADKIDLAPDAEFVKKTIIFEY